MKGIFYLLNEEEENRYLNLQIITNNFLSENVFSFDDKIICFFPVLEGTKYSDKFFTLPSKAVLHYINSMGIDWNSSSVFNINCRTILEKKRLIGLLRFLFCLDFNTFFFILGFLLEYSISSSYSCIIDNSFQELM